MKATAAEKGRMVVAHFLDGRLLKGTMHDFTPNKTEFHLYEGGEEHHHAVAVSADSLKALFFVKSYAGDSHHRADDTFRGIGAHGGRKMRVRFTDGEVMTGSTMGYNPQKQGFFLVPADPDDNNERVFILNAAVAEVAWL
jgi:hypothetical protein